MSQQGSEVDETEFRNELAEKERQLLLKELELLRMENGLLQNRRDNVEKSLNLREVEDCLPTFGEDSGNNSVEKWLQEIEENSNLFGWSELQQLVCAKKLLRGTAKLWLNAQPTLKTWKLFKAEIISEFGHQVSSACVHKELSTRKKKPSENCQEYLIIMRGIAQKTVIEEEALVEYVIDGIPDREQNKMMLYGAKSVADLKEKLKLYTAFKEKEKRHSDEKPTKEEKSKPRTTTTDRCHNCGKLGHKVKDCKSLEKGPKCFRCNNFGHIASKCSKSESQANNKVEDKSETKKSMQVTNKTSRDRMCKTVEVNQFPIEALIDTGSDVNLIRAEDYFKIGSPKIEGVTQELKGLGSRIKTLGCFKADVKMDESTYTTNIHVVPQSAMDMSLVIGGELLSQASIIITKENVKVMRIEVENDIQKVTTDCTDANYVNEVTKMIDNYNPKEPKTTVVTTKIILKDELPIHQTPRRLSVKEDEEVQRQIEEWLEKKIIRPSNSEYSSPIVLVKKKNGSTRICVDYRKLNKHVVKDRYPLPVIEDQIDKLQGTKIFSTIDLKNGFFHVPVEESSIKYTAFVTPRGQYEFLRTPFGYCNSPLSFQRYINHIFKEAIREGILLVYLDDLVILAKNEEEALQRLKIILQVAEDHGLQINWQKCSFLCRTIEYLGYEISENKIKPSTAKINAVSNYPEPKTVKQIQSFLGLSGYFRKFIPNYATIARPLYDLLKKESKFKFGAEERISFHTLKTALSEPVLRIYNPTAATELHTDASRYGLGAILLQQDDHDGKMHPVYYYSKKTNEAEQRYTSYELEVLAIITALKKFRVYLYGIDFKIVTDCAAFQMTMSKKDITTRIARWALQLEDFSYTIEHRPGVRMKHVDALSRNPVSMVVSRGVVAQIKQAQKADHNLRAIVRLIEETGNHEDYLVESGVLYKEQEGRKLLVLPKIMQMETVGKVHVENGHFAVRKVQELIEREFWFPEMKKKIEKYIANCIPCIMAERKKGKKECLLKPIEKGDRPLETYHIDHLGPLLTTKKNYKYLLAVVDGFTKFVWLYPVKTTTSEETIGKLELQASTFGNPKRLISDRGTSFTSTVFNEYCTKNDIEHLSITTGVPRGNGQVERIFRTIIPVLTKLSLEKPTEWYKHTTGLQRVLNNTFQRSINRTPFEMLIGTKMRTLEQVNVLEAIEEEVAKNYDEERNMIRNEAKASIMKVQEENKRNYDRKRKEARKYKMGDAVAVKRTQFKTQSKLLPKFLGPYKIFRCKNNDRYDLLKIGDGEGPQRTSSSADMMKPWGEEIYSSESDEDQDGRVCGNFQAGPALDESGAESQESSQAVVVDENPCCCNQTEK